MTEAKDTLLDRFGRWLAGRLQEESSGYEPYTPSDPEIAAAHAGAGRHPADRGQPAHLRDDQVPHPVDLVAFGALCRRCAAEAGGRLGAAAPDRGQSRRGLRRRAAVANTAPTTPASAGPSGLSPDDRDQVVNFMVEALGLKYDLKNILDMLRYFFPRRRCRCAGAAACSPSARATRRAPSARR